MSVDLLDPIQNKCHYGYVLPDRCRYKRHLGCPCGAYPAIPGPVGRLGLPANADWRDPNWGDD